MSETYLAVLKALYDYDAPQSEDEVSIKEDQILLLLEKTDDDWWKVKVKPSSPDDDGPSGLVPSAYVEEMPHNHLVKVVYDYDATVSSELTVKEEEILYSYEMDDGWMLVKSRDSGKVGYIPGNYVETIDEAEEDNDEQALALPAPTPSPPPDPVTPISDAMTKPSDTVTGKSKADDIQTWSLSEVDKKGKKKKGTLGVGNGAVFFASTDKTPVQKWQIADVDAVRIEKGKQIVVETRGANSTTLRYQASSKDNAEAILKKIEKSIDMQTVAYSDHAEPMERPISPPAPMQAQTASVPVLPPPIKTQIQEEPRKNGVHFANSPPVVIPRSDDDETEEAPAGAIVGVALYDFTAGGEDELTVNEGDQLWVIDKSSEDWWTCRSMHGSEGVVPASYIEVVGGSEPAAEHDADSPSEAQEDDNEVDEEQPDVSVRQKEEEDNLRALKERQEKQERALAEQAKAQQAEKRRIEAAAADQKRKEKEREEAEAAKRVLQQEQEAKARSKAAEQETAAAAKKERRRKETQSSSRGDTKGSGNKGPLPKNTRTWHDKTGQFSADAEFLGMRDGKIRLHKANGVVIEVPATKMSPEDMEYIRRLLKKKGASSNAHSSRSRDEDDMPLAAVRDAKKPAESVAPPKATAPKNGPSIDWFEFFLSAGCDIDECTRYAAAFERDKIDESILSDIKESTMRSLGLKEGDIIRVQKAILQRTGSNSHEQGGETNRTQKQIASDEELARQLQAQEDGSGRQNSTSPGAPNLFSGPGGTLKNNTRRGRPQPSKSAPPINVDIDSIGHASDSLTKRVSSPASAPSASPVGTPAIIPPKRSTSIAQNGFDDDAWTNRPSSTNPTASQTPAPVKPVDVSQPTVSEPKSTDQSPAATQDANFELLAKISQMRPTSTPPASNLPSLATPPPVPPPNYRGGMGLGSSPLPIAQHLQAQQTGLYAPQSQGARAPIAPIAVNQPLLNPLIPTHTGFNSFIPTRPITGLNPSVPPLPSFTPIGSGSFPTSPTPLVPSATGMYSAPNGLTYNASQQPTNWAALTNPALTSPMQTGLSSSSAFDRNASPFSSALTQPSSPPANSHSPANIFAQMKSGTFGHDDMAQPSDKYDALRMNGTLPSLGPQQTGWGFQQGAGGYSGFAQR